MVVIGELSGMTERGRPLLSCPMPFLSFPQAFSGNPSYRPPPFLSFPPQKETQLFLAFMPRMTEGNGKRGEREEDRVSESQSGPPCIVLQRDVRFF